MKPILTMINSLYQQRSPFYTDVLKTARKYFDITIRSSSWILHHKGTQKQICGIVQRAITVPIESANEEPGA